MSDRLVVNSYFKIIALIIYLFTVLICSHYLGIILLSFVLLFILNRFSVETQKYYNLLIMAVFLCFSLHLRYINVFKFLLILYYFRYLIYSSNCLQLDYSLTKIFKYKVFIIFKKYRLIKEKYSFYVKTNVSLYKKKKRINAFYLACKYTCSYNKDYVLIKEKKCFYDYLFVIMHFTMFLFVFFLEVYR